MFDIETRTGKIEETKVTVKVSVEEFVTWVKEKCEEIRQTDIVRVVSVSGGLSIILEDHSDLDFLKIIGMKKKTISSVLS